MGKEPLDTPLLSVVIPTRNEAGNVAALVERLAEVLSGVPVELIFIDDSSDDTPDLLRISAGNYGGRLGKNFVYLHPDKQVV